MPRMDGFEVLSYINKYQWNDTLAVIMISSDDSPENIKRAYSLGAFDFISRPFDSTIIRRRISNTMFLYARQRCLENIIAEQFYEQERHNKLMISILSHLVEFRNGESGLHVLHVDTITELLLKHLIQLTDRYPLSKSDITLISTASSLHDIVRKTDTVIRYGGDEFIIIFYRIPADVFKKKLEGIRHAVDMLVINEYPENSFDRKYRRSIRNRKNKGTVKTADSLMYQAKITKKQVRTRFLGFETDDNKKEDRMIKEEQHQ